MLADDLWSPRDAYDAGHNLLVPLHYAFTSSEISLLAGFEAHFKRMVEAYRRDEVDVTGLNEFQYLALAGRFLAMNASNQDTRLNEDIADIIERRVSHYWTETPARMWSRQFPGGIRERLAWKLDNKTATPSHLRAVTDAEMYLIGLAADLGVWKARIGKACGVCADALSVFDRIVESEFDRSAEGWHYQVGVWASHPDYAYAGYLTKPDANAEPSRLPSIQEDSSHAHRWPLWLMQLSSHRDVSDLVSRLRWQLLNRVLDPYVDMGVPVLRNFMSGHNGYYRWRYQTLEADTGYGPYMLSGTFILGWWGFLGGEEIAELYRQAADAYPLSPAQQAFYGTISTRERHPAVRDSHQNGLRSTIVRMAESIARGDH